MERSWAVLLGRWRGRADAIIDWAGLSEFADVAVRAFSSGMLARLGFSIVTDINPDVLLVDEILSVGDQSFREKSRKRVGKVMERGAATILVSHDMQMIEDLASRAIWLDRGRIRREGSPADSDRGLHRRRPLEQVGETGPAPLRGSAATGLDNVPPAGPPSRPPL